ncbi:hypothetical protein MPSYJ_27390 [Mycolicibacterium psychrotolerans]|uniref:Transposase n=1 Tax=Mycolicibacterium psychrotolerans TaxID=216929 RepID=A0A7I7MAK4_9MYCO|nr:hypothetical protein MPSYJ_27390 [Mycolicibacterium psychrotolerans]
MLGEFGDDPNRYTTAKSRENHAGTPPLTVPSGKEHPVPARHVRNRRLYDAIDQWASRALTQVSAPAPSMTSTAPPETGTARHYAPWATASSASCTAAFATGPPTANTQPGPTANETPPSRLHDNWQSWDVWNRTDSIRGTWIQEPVIAELTYRFRWPSCEESAIRYVPSAERSQQ